MSLTFINNFLLVVLLFTLLTGFYVWKSNKKNPLNIGFGIFSVITAAWIFLNYLWGFFQTSQILLTLTYVVSPFIITSMFVWGNYIFKDKISRKLIFLATASGIFDLFFFLVGIFGDGLLVESVKNRFEFTTGPLFPYFSTYFICLISSFLIFFYLFYKKADQKLKQSLNVVIAGILVTLFITSMVSFVLPALGYVDLAIFDAPSIVIFAAVSAYSILKMQLFNIKIVFTEVITYFVLIISFIILFIVKEEVHIGVKLVLMALFVYGAQILTKSVRNEIGQKEELETASHDLKDAYKKLEELDKMKTEFISVASHELLTPISAIEGYLSMMLEEKLVKIDDPKAVQYMDSVYKSSKRLARLVTDLLNVTRIEEGRLLVQKIEIDAKDIINQVISELKFKAQDAKLSVSTYFQEGADTMVYADPDKIKEVLINIAGNSIKYTPEGGHFELGCFIYPAHEIAKKFEDMQEDIIKCNSGPVDESLQKAVDKRLKQFVGDDQLVIFSKDTGVGLKPDDLCRLFKKFSRVGEWSTRQVQGTGLGLYISKALVEMHHGRIWAESAGENTGSQFFFSLPLARNRKEIEDIDKKIPQAADAKPLAKNKEIN